MRKFFRIAAIVFVVFVAAAIFALGWAIVTGRAKRQAADAAYITDQNLRAIYHAEREYYIHHEYLGFPCTFSTLTAKPDPLLDEKFATGHANSYTFTFSDCKHLENVGFNGNASYRLIATPDPGSAVPLPTYCVDDDVDKIPRGDMLIVEHPPIAAGTPGSGSCTQ